MQALQFDQVHQQYRSAAGVAHTLNGASFTVPAGQLFALIGVNGAGKTTLLRCLLDLRRASAGSIRIFGIDSTASTARHQLCFLPERFIVPASLTGWEFLRLACDLHQVPFSQQGALALTQKLELDPDVLQRLARTYSKGMTQKLGLTSALLSDKPLLVLDEPLSGLDPQARACTKRALLEARAQAKTILFTTHALADVTELADGMALLHQGKVVFEGQPHQLVERAGGATLEQAFLRTIGAAPSEPG